jgi:Tol biopolymer transport system component
VWSPDGKRLAFFRNDRGRVTIQVASWPGLETKEITDVAGLPRYANHRIATLSWSPDGRSLVFAEKPADAEPARIMRVDIATSTKRQLTAPSGDAIGDFDPSYSRDGRIAFVRAPAAYSILDVWIMDADGLDARRVTTGRWAFVHSVGWLDEKIVFTAGDLFSQRAYSVLPSDGTPRPLPGLGDNDRSANGAGGRLVFAKYEMGLRLWQVPSRGGEPRDLGIDGSKLVFTPDGKRIAWQKGNAGHVQIWMAERNGDDPRVLVSAETDAFDPQWSPDGEELLFTSLDSGNWDVYAIEVERGHRRQLTTDKKDDQYPTYSQDGRWIYFSSNRSGSFEVYRMRADAGSDAAAERLTTGGGLGAVTSVDGFLYYEGDPAGIPSRATDTPIWRRSLELNDEPTQVLAGWGARADRSWVLARRGIYFMNVGDLVRGGADFSIHYIDFATGNRRLVHSEKGAALYPAISPDEQVVTFSKQRPRGSELWLVENFSD